MAYTNYDKASSCGLTSSVGTGSLNLGAVGNRQIETQPTTTNLVDRVLGQAELLRSQLNTLHELLRHGHVKAEDPNGPVCPNPVLSINDKLDSSNRELSGSNEVLAEIKAYLGLL